MLELRCVKIRVSSSPRAYGKKVTVVPFRRAGNWLLMVF